MHEGRGRPPRRAWPIATIEPKEPIEPNAPNVPNVSNVSNVSNATNATNATNAINAHHRPHRPNFRMDSAATRLTSSAPDCISRAGPHS